MILKSLNVEFIKLDIQVKKVILGVFYEKT